MTLLKAAVPAALILLVLTSCARFHPPIDDLPPLLTQDELIRPHQNVGTIQITRKIFRTIETMSDADYQWGLLALREEARKIHADAVIFPEVTTSTDRLFLFIIPCTEFVARGTAITFRP